MNISAYCVLSGAGLVWAQLGRLRTADEVLERCQRFLGRRGHHERESGSAIDRLSRQRLCVPAVWRSPPMVAFSPSYNPNHPDARLQNAGLRHEVFVSQQQFLAHQTGHVTE